MCPNLAISGWEAPREPKKVKGRKGAGRERDAAGTHCARSGPARSPPPHPRRCAGSSWRGRGGRRCTGAAGGWPRPSRSARAAPRPRGRRGPRLRPARGRPGPRRRPQRAGSAWHLPRAPGAAPAAGVREAAGTRCETVRAEAVGGCWWLQPSRQPCTPSALRLRRRADLRPAALYSTSHPRGGLRARDTEHFLPGLHQAPAPAHTHSHPPPAPAPTPGCAWVTPPRPPGLGGGGEGEEAPLRGMRGAPTRREVAAPAARSF